MNVLRFQLVIDQITQHPETWDQEVWHCGSTHCVAGWAQVMSGNAEDELTASEDARTYLELARHEAQYVFSPERTLEELNDFLVHGL